MTGYVTRSDALTVGCPYCKATPGQPCHTARDLPRAASHKERRLAYMHEQRERRFYDLDQDYIPAGHHDHPPAREPARIPDDDRIRGLAHCHQILEQLAARGLATGRQHP